MQDMNNVLTDLNHPMSCIDGWLQKFLSWNALSLAFLCLLFNVASIDALGPSWHSMNPRYSSLSLISISLFWIVTGLFLSLSLIEMVLSLLALPITSTDDFFWWEFNIRYLFAGIFDHINGHVQNLILRALKLMLHVYLWCRQKNMNPFLLCSF